LTPFQAGDCLAALSGPGAAQLDKPVGKLSYPASIRRRLNDYGLGEKIRIYRENLLFGTWEKSLETIVALSEITTSPISPRKGSDPSGLFDTHPRGTLHAPSTIIYAENDAAFDKRMALAAVEDYLGCKGSQVLRVRDCGHWIPVEENGRGVKVLKGVLEWSMGGEEEGLKKRGVEGADIICEK
jgi:pimeloyl-ACP methyl ester carboxylesterase